MPNETALRILVITSRPLINAAGNPIPLLDVEEERRRVSTGLKRAGVAAQVYFLPEATTSEVKTALRDEWDVVHFTGHGTEDGYLVLEDGLAVAHFLAEQETAQLFTGQQAPLVVLSACHSETLGRGLIGAGIPGVVAVDADKPIADRAAIIFAEHFYSALAKGWNIQKAFDEAQRAVALDPEVGDSNQPFDAQGNPEQVWSERFMLIGETDRTIPAGKGEYRESGARQRLQGNLRTRNKNFVGRAKEISRIVNAFEGDDARRVAVCGAGGLGKTELSQAVAWWYVERDRVDAVLWASASRDEGEYTLLDLASLLSIAGRVFKLPITEQSSFDEQKQAVREFGSARRVLVILDNWETIEPRDRGELWKFVLSLPETTRVLVTSRSVLPANDARNIELDTLAPADAVELFINVARNAGYFDRNPSLSEEEVAILDSLCERLSGYPLAIEVVAGQTASRTLGEIWNDLLRVPRNVLEGKDENTGEPRGVWTSLNLSYDVLDSEDEKSMFRQMGILLAPASAEDIAVITEIANPRSVLDTLVKRSLVQMREGAYSLSPIVRVYAEGKLEETDQDRRELHLRAVDTYSQKETLEDSLTASSHLYELAVRFGLLEEAISFIEYVTGFYDQLVKRGYWAEALRKTEQILAATRVLRDKDLEAHAMCELGTRYHDIGEYERAKELYRKCLRHYEENGYKSGIAKTLHQMANVAYRQGSYGEAMPLYQQSLKLAEELRNWSGIAMTLHQMGMIAEATGDYNHAMQLYQQSLKIAERLGEKDGIAGTLHQMANVASRLGNYSEAMRLYQQSLELKEELGDKSGISMTVHQMGVIAQAQGKHSEAMRLYQQSLTIEQELGDKHGIATSTVQLGMAASAEGNFSDAMQLFEQGLNLHEELGDKRGIATTLAQLGGLANSQGRMKEALGYFLRAHPIFVELNSPFRETVRLSIMRIREQAGDQQFAAWLEDLSTDDGQAKEFLEQNDGAEHQLSAEEFMKGLTNTAETVVEVHKYGNAEQQAAMAQVLTQMDEAAGMQNMAEVVDFIAVLRMMLAGEDASERIAGLVEPYKQIAENARVAGTNNPVRKSNRGFLTSVRKWFGQG